MTDSSYPCKGAPGQPKCPEKVTYRKKIVFGFVLDIDSKGGKKPKRETAYLTCKLNHTNPYTIDGSGEILG